MKDLRKATVTIANASNQEQSFVPYAQSFLYKLAPQDAIQFQANSIQAIYYQKQNQGPIASQAIGEDDVKITFVEGTGIYNYVAGKVIGETIVDEPISPNEIRWVFKIQNPSITSKEQLPDGDNIAKIRYVENDGQLLEWLEFGRDAGFNDDGSIYFGNEVALGFWKNEIQINWGDGFESYPFDATPLIDGIRVQGDVPPQPTTYNIDGSGIENGYNSGDTTIEENGTATITIVANSGYVIPQTITQENIVGATYNDDYNDGTFTISNPTSDVNLVNIVCEAEQPQPTGLTPFALNDNIAAGDYYVFDTSKGSSDGSSCEILTFLQSLNTAGEGGTSLYVDGVCNLVSDANQEAGYLIAVNMGTFYALVVGGGVSGPTGWANETSSEMGISAGWQGLDQDGKVQLNSATGEVGYLCLVAGWNGVIVGFEKGE